MGRYGGGKCRKSLPASGNRILARDNRYNGAMTRTRKHPGTMTARQFAKAVERLNVTPATLDRAWRVLVEGKTAREVAESDGVTKSLI